MRFRERNQAVLGAGCLLDLLVARRRGAQLPQRLPLVIDSTETYTAEFVNAAACTSTTT